MPRCLHVAVKLNHTAAVRPPMNTSHASPRRLLAALIAAVAVFVFVEEDTPQARRVRDLSDLRLEVPGLHVLDQVQPDASIDNLPGATRRHVIVSPAF